MTEQPNQTEQQVNLTEWQPIETAPVGMKMFVVIGVTKGNKFTGGRRYTTDPYCVCLV